MNLHPNPVKDAGKEAEKHLPGRRLGDLRGREAPGSSSRGLGLGLPAASAYHLQAWCSRRRLGDPGGGEHLPSCRGAGSGCSEVLFPNLLLSHERLTRALRPSCRRAGPGGTVHARKAQRSGSARQLGVVTRFRWGSSECVRLLIDVGANLEAHDCHFGTPLHVACAREHLDCVKVLLNAGANVNAAKLHETALHHAAKVKNVDLIEMLVEFGGNIYARDNRGKKPSDYTWSSSAPAKRLEFYEKTPLSLAQLCRVSLRKATGVRGLEKISKLNIPPRLIDYLSYN
ncbi:ankyrin repeat and socs box protein 13 [Lynx pardinus]|uniref:Ankyrin repeat and socs box protein 13 n=1 Tax=Lynx pardinus TaxID=191816 RepID=A0A485N4M7_LYNPA|nr:ankyrin repeat and socs box protein 13 [Lynx pardinus]